jgi:type IV pilus assembly protein PilM
MALPTFDSGARKKRDQILAIDLGSRTTKAVHLQRRGNEITLCRYALLDAPVYEKTLSVELLSEHLKSVSQALDSKAKLVAMAVGVNEALVRHVDMPRMPAEDMRQALKLSPKNYLQQELPNYVFDCHILSNRQKSTAETAKNPLNAQKQKVLVAGAKKQLVDDFLEATKTVGLVADQIIPGLICPFNAFERAMPEAFSSQVVALVDIGFRGSSICIIQEGELALTRMVTLGGDRLTQGLAEMMSTSYAEAEGIKIGMAQEVQSQLEALVSPLGRELRASIDFFEHQQDRPVTQVYVTGGSALSEIILQALQVEMMVECKTWNPAATLQLGLPATQAAEFTHVAPQLTVALGAAFAAF